jgi:hypothetical protein
MNGLLVSGQVVLWDHCVPLPSKNRRLPMVEVQRIWRVTTSANGAIDVRLSHTKGNHRIFLSEEGKDRVFAVDEARAIGQAMLEACEVDSVLTEDLAPDAVAPRTG